MQLRSWIRRNITWIRLVRHCVFSVALFVLVMLIDRGVIPVIDAIPSFLKTPVSVSQMMLAALAGALLTITTFSFAAILTLLNHYSSNYSPRIVENILNRNTVMSVVGMNAGGFLYSILALAFGVNDHPDRLIVAGMAAALYSIACILYFIYFVYGVAIRVKSSYIIESLFEEAAVSIASAAKTQAPHPRLDRVVFAHRFQVPSPKNGFLEAVDNEGIVEFFDGAQGRVTIPVPIGDHVLQGDAIAVVELAQPLEPSVLADLDSYFDITQEKDITFDYRFGVTKLVEIALRAISAGINDPNTAIHCIYQIGTLTGRIAAFRDDVPHPVRLGDFELVQTEPTMSQDLNLAYEQLIHYGKADISVVRALFLALQVTYDHAQPSNHQTIRDFESYLYESVVNQFPLEQDQRKIAAHRLKLSSA